MADGADVMRARAIPELERICRDARLFLSMPFLEGIAPRILNDPERSQVYKTDEPLERRHGIFRVDEVGLPVFDHGGLYGDGVFEGVLITGGRVFTWREHLSRFRRSAEKVGIDIPYSDVDLTIPLLNAVCAMGLQDGERGYIRLIATRGIGDLGINPSMCIGATLYALTAKIQLYPEAVYQSGIALAVARSVRRPSTSMLDPNVKSCNYLNNIMGLVATQEEGCLETLMLTQEGYVAEATADNVFLVEREDGWETDPSKVQVITPADAYGLCGITRGLVLQAADELGYRVVRSETMLPSDFMGANREAFLTGTGAGLMPVVTVDGQSVGNGQPGTVTVRLRDALLKAMADPALGISIDADENTVRTYLDI